MRSATVMAGEWAITVLMWYTVVRTRYSRELKEPATGNSPIRKSYGDGKMSVFGEAAEFDE